MAAAELGGELRLNQKTYRWFGRSVGNYPLPKGMTEADLGKCEAAVHFPGINYEMGLAKAQGEDGLFPLFDFWGTGGTHDGQLLQRKIGKDAGLFMQSYTKHATIRAAEAAGYTVAGTHMTPQGECVVELMVF